MSYELAVLKASLMETLYRLPAGAFMSVSREFDGILYDVARNRINLQELIDEAGMLLQFIRDKGLLHKFKTNDKESHFCSLEDLLIKIKEEVKHRQEIIEDI